MFPDDITPEAVDELLAELSAMLAVEDAASSAFGPRVRLVRCGDRTAAMVQQIGEYVELTFDRRTIRLALADVLSALENLANGELVELVGAGRVRVRLIQRQDLNRVYLITDEYKTWGCEVATFWTALSSAGLGVSA